MLQFYYVLLFYSINLFKSKMNFSFILFIQVHATARVTVVQLFTLRHTTHFIEYCSNRFQIGLTMIRRVNFF